MTAGGNGDDGRQPSGSLPVPRTPVETPGKAAVRASDHGGTDSMMGAADTAIALRVSASGTQPEARDRDSRPDSGFTEPDLRASSLGDEDMLLGTTLLGRYQITKKIGQGGMGAVYEATHTLIGKRVAVKVLLDKYAKKDQIVARLEQEARLASSIGHEHIIDITDFGTTGDGRTFVVMEFLEGESLAECLAREGTLPENRILQIAAQIASALGAAHAKGVVHRDVKPENVFLLRRNDKDFAKVVDFGISKNLRATGEGPDSPRLTQTGMVLGTPLYMSPEQARGDDELDHRIDVYALGVIMYELATGKVPFAGTNYLSVISQVLNDDPAPVRQLRPELSKEFEAIVLRALEKERDHRYGSTEEMLADINVVLDDPLRSTQRPRIVAPRRRGLRASRFGLPVLAWIVGISVVMAAVAITVSLTMGSSSDGATPAAVPVDAGRVVVIDAPPPIDAPPLPKVEVVDIWINTKPPGAMLYQEGREFGPTPVQYQAVLGNEKIELVAVLDGYDEEKVKLNPLTDRKHDTQDNPVWVKLKKAKPGGAKKIVRDEKPDPTGTGTGTGSSTGSGSGRRDRTDLEGLPPPPSGP